MVTVILTLAVVIIIVVLLLSVITTKKAYQYKHTIDPIEGNQHLTGHEADEENTYHNEQR